MRDPTADDPAKARDAAWWIKPSSFKGLGRPLPRVYYLGGLPGRRVRAGRPKPRRMELGPGGVVLSGAFGRGFAVPWPSVDALEVRAPDDVTPAIAHAADESAVIVVRLRQGAEGRFLVEGATPKALGDRLAGITGLIDSSRPQPPTGQALGESIPTSVADELVKLAHLHDTGALTDAEFAAAKRAVLAAANAPAGEWSTRRTP